MRSPFMLRCDWADFSAAEYLAPNCVAEAGKDFQFTDDRLRLALAEATLRQGKKVGSWEVAAEVARGVVGSAEFNSFMAHARSPEIEKRVRTSTEEFHRLQVTQRPTFLVDSETGDRAVFSGFAKPEPVAAALDAMLEDLKDYASFAAHFGGPPP